MRPVPPGHRAHARRESIIETALRLWDQCGFEHTTVEDIAVASGLSKGTLYFYFCSKEAILAAVGSRAVQVARSPGGDDGVLSVIGRFVGTLRSLPAPARASIALALLAGPEGSPGATARHELMGAIAERLPRRGNLDGRHETAAAVSGVVLAWLVEQARRGHDAQVSVESWVSPFLEGGARHVA